MRDYRKYENELGPKRWQIVCEKMEEINPITPEDDLFARPPLGRKEV